MTAQKQDTGGGQTMPVVSIHDRGGVVPPHGMANHRFVRPQWCKRSQGPHGVTHSATPDGEYSPAGEEYPATRKPGGRHAGRAPGGKRSQVPHLRTVAPVRIVDYSGQERPHEPAAPETAYSIVVKKTGGWLSREGYSGRDRDLVEFYCSFFLARYSLNWRYMP